jgi:hypothetical protein
VNWAVLRREWGAVTFVLTVVVGVILVPVALYLTNVTPSPLTPATTPTVVTPVASGVASPSPSSVASSATSPSP